jgi:5'-nucleotidase
MMRVTRAAPAAQPVLGRRGQPAAGLDHFVRSLIPDRQRVLVHRSRRRDAQDGRRRRRGPSLVDLESREPLDDRGMIRHARSVANVAYAASNGRAPQHHVAPVHHSTANAAIRVNTPVVRRYRGSSKVRGVSWPPFGRTPWRRPRHVEEVRVPLTVVPRPVQRGSLALALLALLALVIPAGVFAVKPGTPPVTIQILNVSDWHGQIDPTGNPPTIGGAWSIADRWAEDRLEHPTLTLTAGDDFGATPPLSSFFNEVPAVLVQRMMGMQVGTFGNHNFDRGIAHLQQMIDLAGAPTDADHPGTPFRYVAANLANLNANLTGVEPFAFFSVGGAKVAVIGIVNEEAPTLVSPGAFGTIAITNGAAAANHWAAKARKAGANAVIVITHKGVRGTDLEGKAFGELVDFANDVDSDLIDVIIGDHTDVKYSETIDGILVHENKSKGVTYAKTLLNVQPGKGGGVTGKSMTFVDPPTAPFLTAPQLVAAECPAGAGVPDRYCDADILARLSSTRVELAVQLDVKVATATATFPRGSNLERREEVAVGNLTAEGMKWFEGTDFALMNSGGIRAPLPSPYVPLNPAFVRPPAAAPWDLVLGDIYSVLPFTNTVLKRTVTGAQLWSALENGVNRIQADGTGTDGRFPQIAGFRFKFDYARPTGCSGTSGAADWVCVPSRVYEVTKADGTPIPKDGTVFTIAIPSFVNQGGDSYRMFNDGDTGSNELLDAAVMQAYFAFLGGGAFPALTPTTDGRIQKCSGCAPPPAP